ncbi:putative methyltransferase-domain-containing protein [Syncephalis plumigaleata]|nr:putative methyltransferase-domain-containing protein [Syncephalis plumigaleata]
MTTKFYCFGSKSPFDTSSDSEEQCVSDQISDENYGEVQVAITEQIDPSFHCYVWPSALMLAEYVWHNRSLFDGTTTIELGAGTGLPGLLAAKLGGHVYLTDLPRAMPQLEQHIQENNLTMNASHHDEETWHGWAQSHPLVWGSFDNEGLIKLVDSLDSLDWILGADLFYDSKDFEAILITVAYLLDTYPEARFVTTYQERSATRTLQPLLDRWQLAARVITGDQFGWDPDAFALSATQNQQMLNEIEKNDKTHLKHVTPEVKNKLPTKEDIEAEKKEAQNA